MKYLTLVAISAILLNKACQNPQNGNSSSSREKVSTTASGLMYVITEKGKGRKPKPGETVKVHYTGMLQDSTIFDSSHDRGQPLPFKLGKGQVIKGWDEGIALLNQGGKAVLTIPPQLGYGSRDMGKIPPNSTLIFEVELVEIVEPPKPYNVQDLDTIHLESGLKYMLVEKSSGRKAEPYRTVTVHYTGFLLNGDIFDSSVERNQPFQFKLGVGQVIKGWDEGIAKLKIGEKARLVIPPHLGYGNRNMGAIPAQSTLVFDVQLIDVN